MYRVKTYCDRCGAAIGKPLIYESAEELAKDEEHNTTRVFHEVVILCEPCFKDHAITMTEISDARDAIIQKFWEKRIDAAWFGPGEDNGDA